VDGNGRGHHALCADLAPIAYKMGTTVHFAVVMLVNLTVGSSPRGGVVLNAPRRGQGEV
jgi:TRAP-type C4-dicarboxylate transport system permease large subunit